MTVSLTALLLQLSESGDPAILWGRQAKPYFGKDFDRLLNSRLLMEEARAEEWDRCDACECDHDVRLIHEINGQFIAACPISSRSDSVLDPEDMRSFKINQPALVAEVAKASGFPNEPQEVMPGVWRLGVSGMKAIIYFVLNREGAAYPGLISVLKANSDGLPMSLIAPVKKPEDFLRLAAASIHVVQTADAFAPEGAPLAIDMTKMAPAVSHSSRLTLYRAQSKMVLDGDPLDLPKVSFQLLWLLADHATRGDGLIDRRQIEDALWSTTVSRTAAADAIRNLRKALKKLDRKDRSTGSLIKTMNIQGYVLDIAASDIRLLS